LPSYLIPAHFHYFCTGLPKGQAQHILKHPGEIKITDYHYDLPSERIAQYPLARRDESRLLVYKDGQINTDIFKNLTTFLPAGGRLILNETKVIPARIIFNKPTGARIEIFCLEPSGLVNDYQLALQQGPGCEWKCYVGNSRRWNSASIEGTLEIAGQRVRLLALKVSRQEDHFIIRFEWMPGSLSFSEILEHFGKVPLPPYIQRDTVEADKDRYQTVFARKQGSVAAPTAGLHFTGDILSRLHEHDITTSAINLHVGAGTFKPVSSDQLSGHTMHSEHITVSANLIREITENQARKNILVGTTTVRTMESLYWLGARWLREKPGLVQMDISQWEPYQLPAKNQPPVTEAFEALLFYLERDGLMSICGHTSLLIAPGYRYKVPDVIITNFHMPQSTLLLLVSAFIGDAWKEVYRYALDNNFRFLSYGDSCLLFK